MKHNKVQHSDHDDHAGGATAAEILQQRLQEGGDVQDAIAAGLRDL
jgi:hypothetical protein